MFFVHPPPIICSHRGANGSDCSKMLRVWPPSTSVSPEINLYNARRTIEYYHIECYTRRDDNIRTIRRVASIAYYDMTATASCKPQASHNEDHDSRIDTRRRR